MDRALQRRVLCFNVYEMVYDDVEGAHKPTLYGTYTDYELAQEDAWNELRGKRWFITAERVVATHRPYAGKKKGHDRT